MPSNNTPATGRKTTRRLKSASRIEIRETRRERFMGAGPRTSFAFRLIAVAHAVDRIDAVELRIDRFELLADALHVAVDGPLADVVVVRVTLASELAPGLDMAGMADQCLQH